MTAPFVLAAMIVAAASPPLPPEKSPTPSQASPQTSVPDELPPYQGELERLAELMGTLTYMQDLCTAGGGIQWRNKMTELLAAEGISDLRRNRLAGAFNRGLRDYAVTYVRCTPAANVVVGRALDEAARLTRDLSARFGG
ncbi:TIGR02301 family protein [Lichenifustis flavocetrariae]|uniref:TIGR02301 family protein n=1 Tax=Lichenifustis flavocetrariae TaxID=2949735 RepID=A0AA41YZK2_9HYPH|nr:TIGR02301 family protein [Lichenifustis flavocetrariae]MCW6510132.1 TIGR02301 family protein [Lichenifustis flavocetrariae]